MIRRIKKIENPSSHFGRILAAVVAVFFVVQVFLANSLSVQGKDISSLENTKSRLEREVSALKQKSGKLSSLDSIRLLAKESLGMVEGFDSFDYFGSSVALR